MNNDAKLILSVFLLAVVISVGVVYVGILTKPQIIGNNFGVVEQLKITNVDFNSSNIAIVTIRNSAQISSTINSAWIDGQIATLESDKDSTATILRGTSANFTVTIKDGSQFSLGEEYLFKLVTAKGTSISYTAIYNPTT